MEIELELQGAEELSTEIKKVLDSLSVRERRKILRRAAAPIREEARRIVPVAEREVRRYDTPKLFSRLRAPKGMGRVKAIYVPGNLEKSIQSLTFRRSPDIFVGPKKKGRKEVPVYGQTTRTVDPYYAHMVHDGTVHSKGVPFMLMAYRAKKNEALRIIREGIAEIINKADK